MDEDGLNDVVEMDKKSFFARRESRQQSTLL
jgi:hypothetical protein